MELLEAMKILRSLASGENPDTGQPLAADSVLEQPKVIRALHRVLQELESKERIELKRKKKEERHRERDKKTGRQAAPKRRPTLGRGRSGTIDRSVGSGRHGRRDRRTDAARGRRNCLASCPAGQGSRPGDSSGKREDPIVSRPWASPLELGLRRLWPCRIRVDPWISNLLRLSVCRFSGSTRSKPRRRGTRRGKVP